jgi:hypothetical protein
VGISDIERRLGYTWAYIGPLWSLAEASDPERKLSRELESASSGNSYSVQRASEMLRSLARTRCMAAYESAPLLGLRRGETVASKILLQYFRTGYTVAVHREVIKELIQSQALPLSFLSDWEHALKRLGEGKWNPFEGLLADFFWSLAKRNITVEHLNEEVAQALTRRVERDEVARRERLEKERLKAEFFAKRKQIQKEEQAAAREAQRLAALEAERLRIKRVEDQRLLELRAKENYPKLQEIFTDRFGQSADLVRFVSMNENFFLRDDETGFYLDLLGANYLDQLQKFQIDLEASCQTLGENLANLAEPLALDVAFRCFAVGAPHVDVHSEENLRKLREIAFTRGKLRDATYWTEAIGTIGTLKSNPVSGVSLRRDYAMAFIQAGEISLLGKFVSELWAGTPTAVIGDYFTTRGSRFEAPGKFVN